MISKANHNRPEGTFQMRKIMEENSPKNWLG
jgi:hypothetical protein